MKKGFTLIELLIVMVLIGVLVVVALPKYQRALERGRALEGLTNLRAAMDYANAHYLLDGSYSNVISTADMVKNKYFPLDDMSYSCSSASTSCMITLPRGGSDWGYELVGVSTNGEPASLKCENTGAEDVCTQLDLDASNLL